MAQAGKTRKVFDNRYEILSIVGRGQRSVVYHARHVTAPASEVALKVLLNENDQKSNADRLRREALAMVSSRHRYVIRLDDFHSVGDLCYLSMEYAPECDLRKYLAKVGTPLNPAQGAAFLAQMCEALQFIHKGGIIHRDIKPDNILVVNAKEVRLGDFGVAVLPGTESSLDELQRGVGTMNYMAPEVLEGVSYEMRSDIYALALSFYEMLAGSHPFEHAPLMQQLEVRRDGNFPHLSTVSPAIPAALADAIMKALSFNKDDRFATAKEFQDAIDGTAPQTQPVIAEKPALSNLVEMPLSEPPAAETETPAHETARQSDTEETSMIDDKPSEPNSAGIEETPPRSRRSLASQALGRPAEETDDTLLDEEGAVDDYTEIDRLLDEDTEADEAPPLDIFAPEDQQAHHERPHQTPTVNISKEEVEKIKKAAKETPREEAAEAAPRRRSLMPVVLFLVAIFVGYKFTQRLSPGEPETTPASNHSTQPQETAEQEPSAPAESPHLGSYPLLPAGAYSGTINGLVPGRSLPITLLSSASRNTLTLIVAMEGWAPATISYEEWLAAGGRSNPNKPLRFSANGFLLEWSGDGGEDALSGTFVNQATGDEGTWHAHLSGEYR